MINITKNTSDRKWGMAKLPVKYRASKKVMVFWLGPVVLVYCFS